MAVKEYTVIANAIVLRLEKGRNGVRRFLRGTKLKMHENDPRVATLLKTKSVVCNDDRVAAGRKPVEAVSVKAVAAALGAPDDPVQAPNPAILPVKASNDQVEDSGFAPVVPTV